MTIITGHGSDAVADSGNEKARWAGTHRARFVFTYRWPNFLRPNQRDSHTF
jgi:hypothetical protein